VNAEAINTLVKDLRAAIPDLEAVYLFGSEAQGLAGPDSDIDIAVLAAGRLEPARLWDLGSRMAERLGREVDLVDLGSASTVFQHQVIHGGQCLWSRGPSADTFESRILRQYWDLEISRKPILDDILQRGSVHGQ